jgi:excisionase family DNA binding protein
MQTTQAVPETPTLLTVEEAAARLRVSRPTAYRLVRAGILPAVRIGRDGSGPIRVPASELDGWLDEQRTDSRAHGTASPASAAGPHAEAVEPAGEPGPERSAKR